MALVFCSTVATREANSAMGQIFIHPATVKNTEAVAIWLRFIATSPKIAKAALTESILETATGPMANSAAKKAQLAKVPANGLSLSGFLAMAKAASVFKIKTSTNQAIS